MLPRPEFLHVLGASQQNLLADYYWIEQIQATGSARTVDEYADIGAYANLVTDLDPQFRVVYGFAGAAIPVPLGRGRWANTEVSTQVLEKGVRYFPNDLHLNVLLAYNYSYFKHDARGAAELLSHAATLPGAPAYLRPLATRLYAQAGEFDAGLTLAKTLYEQAETPEERAFYLRRIKEIALERVLTRIEDEWKQFTSEQHRPPTSIAELVSTGYLPVLPVDPLGGTLAVDASGNAFSTSEARRLRVYDPDYDKASPEASP